MTQSFSTSSARKRTARHELPTPRQDGRAGRRTGRSARFPVVRLRRGNRYPAAMRAREPYRSLGSLITGRIRSPLDRAVMSRSGAAEADLAHDLSSPFPPRLQGGAASSTLIGPTRSLNPMNVTQITDLRNTRTGHESIPADTAERDIRHPGHGVKRHTPSCAGYPAAPCPASLPVTRLHRKLVPPIGPKASSISPQR